MIFLRNDYSEGAHPRVLAAIAETNMKRTPGYGLDEYCDEAATLIRSESGLEDAAVHFLPGGTISNATVISSALRPYQAVVAAESGHIAVHETGAIEASGHKVLTTPSSDGKLLPEGVEAAVRAHSGEHMVEPKLVYISDLTECGAVYRLAELEALRETCAGLGLYLFCDGARLAQALASRACDYGLAEFARLVDVFCLGGTKNGLLFGEAVVIANPSLAVGFRHSMKRSGAMMAKGRLLGVQFAESMRDSLYLECGRAACLAMESIVSALEDAGVEFAYPPDANMAFPILEDGAVERLAREVSFEPGERIDERRSSIRLVASWATGEADAEAFAKALERALSGS